MQIFSSSFNGVAQVPLLQISSSVLTRLLSTRSLTAYAVHYAASAFPLSVGWWLQNTDLQARMGIVRDRSSSGVVHFPRPKTDD